MILTRTRTRRLERDARRALRRLKVGVLPGLMAEVLAADRRNTAEEVALAYLTLLARRTIAAYVFRTSSPDLDRFRAGQVGRLVGRVEGGRPGGAAPAAGGPPAAALRKARGPALSAPLGYADNFLGRPSRTATPRPMVGDDVLRPWTPRR